MFQCLGSCIHQKSLRFFDVFRGSRKVTLAQYILTKPTFCRYSLHSLRGQFSTFHFLTSLLKALIIVIFFSVQKEPCSRFEDQGIKHFLYHEKHCDFAFHKHYFVFKKSHLLLVQTSSSLL